MPQLSMYVYNGLVYTVILSQFEFETISCIKKFFKVKVIILILEITELMVLGI